MTPAEHRAHARAIVAVSFGLIVLCVLLRACGVG